MVVHDGLDTDVCPTMVDAEVVLCCMNKWKFGVPVGSARILLRFVPSVPINRKFPSGVANAKAAASSGDTNITGRKFPVAPVAPRAPNNDNAPPPTPPGPPGT